MTVLAQAGLVERAEAFLDLLALILAIVVGVVISLLLVAAWRAMGANRRRVERGNKLVALLSSLAAVLVMLVVAAVMTPIAVEAAATGGRVHPVLVIYWLVYAIVLGALAFAGYTLVRAVGQSTR